MWTEPENDPRDFGNPVGEKATYASYLDAYRHTIRMKCEGLDAEQLARRSVPPSTLSLLGLVRHLTVVEDRWFCHVLRGRLDEPVIYKTDGDAQAAFTGAVAEPDVVRASFDAWHARIATAQEWFAAFPEEHLGDAVPTGDGDEIFVRDAVLHVISEYARHTGHVDLLRECVDGRTGM